MVEMEKEPHLCYACDSEFVVDTLYESELPVSFCPFCGSEVGETDDDFDEEEDDIFK